jgi:hypothetical protein
MIFFLIVMVIQRQFPTAGHTYTQSSLGFQIDFSSCDELAASTTVGSILHVWVTIELIGNLLAVHSVLDLSRSTGGEVFVLVFFPFPFFVLREGSLSRCSSTVVGGAVVAGRDTDSLSGQGAMTSDYGVNPRGVMIPRKAPLYMLRSRSPN